MKKRQGKRHTPAPIGRRLSGKPDARRLRVGQHLFLFVVTTFVFAEVLPRKTKRINLQLLV